MKWILPAAFVVALAGCVGRGPVTDLHDFAKLTPGQSTAQEAAALLGKPFAATVIGPDAALVQWVDTRGGGYRSVGVLFDQRGRMIRVQDITGL